MVSLTVSFSFDTEVLLHYAIYLRRQSATTRDYSLVSWTVQSINPVVAETWE
jgi:hypothetical protein